MFSALRVRSRVSAALARGPSAAAPVISRAIRGTSTSTSTGASDNTTHFGFQTVNAADKAGMVGEVFSRVASKYDLMNDVLSVGIHRLWKDQFVHTLNPRAGIRHLDVAGGTGDISFRIMEKLRAAGGGAGAGAGAGGLVVVSDINADMLGVGQDRARKLGYSIIPSPYAVKDAEIQGEQQPNTTSTSTSGPVLTFQQGDAANLHQFPDAHFDSYTIAFGLRNVTDTDAALREAKRVLKKGGRFLCLEFSKMDNVVLQSLYDEYSFKLMPVLGDIFANDRASYQYLAESIRQFHTKDELLLKMKQAGFQHCAYEGMTGGMVAVHSGYNL